MLASPIPVPGSPSRCPPHGLSYRADITPKHAQKTSDCVSQHPPPRRTLAYACIRVADPLNKRPPTKLFGCESRGRDAVIEPRLRVVNYFVASIVNLLLQ